MGLYFAHTISGAGVVRESEDLCLRRMNTAVFVMAILKGRGIVFIKLGGSNVEAC